MILILSELLSAETPGNLETKGSELRQCFQDQFRQLSLTVNPFGIQGRKDSLESSQEIYGGRTRLRNTNRSKQIPTDVSFEQPCKKTGIGSLVTSGLSHHLRPLKHILFVHLRHFLERH